MVKNERKMPAITTLIQHYTSGSSLCKLGRKRNKYFMVGIKERKKEKQEIKQMICLVYKNLK